MSFGNDGGKSTSTEKSSKTQATNYGRDQTTATTGEGDVRVFNEDLSDQIVDDAFDFGRDSLDFAEQSNKLNARTFSELVDFAGGRADAAESTASSAIDTVQDIAKDKATGQQRQQRLTLATIGIVAGTALVVTSRRQGKR